MKDSLGSRLDSWKAIADYLDRDVRTVTRWAHERGLPIHHVPGRKRGAVFAFTTEIDEWLVRENGPGLGTTQPSNGSQGSGVGEFSARPSAIFTRLGSAFWESKSLRIGLSILSVILLAAMISEVLRGRSGQDSRIASVEYGVDTLEGKSADGRTLWVHKYPQQLFLGYFGGVADRNGFRISDYFGDGGREIAAVVPLRSGPNPSDLDLTQVDFFTDTGKLLWTYFPKNLFRFGDHDLTAPWDIQDLLVTQEGDHPTIWVTAAHHTWGNSFVVQLDPRTGQDTLRFVNTGTLRRLSELNTAHGTYLLAGGFNNEWDSGSLAIIDENRAFAVSPQTPGTRHQCNSCPSGVPDYYFVFPRSEINRTAHAYEDSVYEIRLSEEGMEISKHEGFDGGQQSTLYLLQREPPFSVVSLRYDSDYDRVHRAWSAEGKLAHTLENCPERMHPQPVRLWTPSSGWTNIPVRPAKANQ